MKDKCLKCGGYIGNVKHYINNDGPMCSSCVAKESKWPQGNSYGLVGWRCPNCGAGNSPFAQTCTQCTKPPQITF